MGLNILGISNIELTEEDEGIFYLEKPSDKTKYKIIHDYQEGWYNRTHKSEDYVFRAGSLGGYWRFRNILSLVVFGYNVEYIWEHEEDYNSLPFMEIINFMSNEGYFGATLSNKLYNDFKTYASKFAKYVYANIDDINDRNDMIIVYDNWIKALREAKNNGILIFH